MSSHDEGSAPKPPLKADRARVVVVTGLSGAGKSTALRSLEDLGYFCVDNLPTALADETVAVCGRGGIHRVALGIDVRVGAFLDGAVAALGRLAERHDVSVLFLDASDEALLRRFNETRRPHPLASLERKRDPTRAGALAVLDGVALERERLAPLRARATVVVDTTSISVHELRRQVIAHLGPGKAEQPRMITRIMSFGYKYGVPVDADLVFDVRLLENPFFVPELRPLAGIDAKVARFVLDNPAAEELLLRLTGLLEFSLPKYEREGKAYLTIGIGCTGGRHRSVAIAVELARRLESSELPIVVVHRDVGRGDILGTNRPPPLRSEGGGEPILTQGEGTTKASAR